MAQTADQTGIASLGMLDRMMGPSKAETARNVITTIGDMTPMAPEVRRMMGKEPMGMADTLMAGAGLIVGLPMKVGAALAKGTDAVDEAFDLLKGFKSTEDVEATLMSMFKEGMKKRAGGNPDSTMGRIQAFVNEGEGFARKARYYVEFNLPNGVGDILQGSTDI